MRSLEIIDRNQQKPRPIGRIIPGFALSYGLTITLVSLVVLIPLASLAATAVSMPLADWLALLRDHNVIAALRLSFGGAFAASVFNAALGLAMAYILTHYRFPGRKLIDALVDLPFALPTSVAGIALASLYAPHGFLGHPLLLLGIKVAYTPLGIIIAMIFIGLPFVIRTLEPVLKELGKEWVESASILGATPLQILIKIILPSLTPALLTGFSLSFARALGEYGSVIFMAGNLPGYSQIAPVLIVGHLESFDIKNAAAIAFIMLIGSFLILISINVLQKLRRKRLGL